MPLYIFLCDKCKDKKEILMHIDEYDDMQECSCGHIMHRDYKSEGTFSPPQTLGMLAESNGRKRRAAGIADDQG